MGSPHCERNPLATWASPSRSKLCVVRPHARVLLTLGDDGEIAVRPVRLVLRVACEPAEDFESQLRDVLDGQRRHAQLDDQTFEARTLYLPAQEEAGLCEHGLAENDPALRDAIQVRECLRVQAVAWITERDERRRVDEDHFRRPRSSATM